MGAPALVTEHFLTGVSFFTGGIELVLRDLNGNEIAVKWAAALLALR